MSQFQFSVCGICKQEIDLASKQNGIVNCNECDSPYHNSHLEIWLRLDSDCPVCRKDMQKLAFVNYSIKYERIDVSGDLYRQLEEIFPKGIPKPILEKYIREFPEGIPADRFVEIKEQHSSNKKKPLRKNISYEPSEFEKSLDRMSNQISYFIAISILIFGALYLLFFTLQWNWSFADEIKFVVFWRVFIPFSIVVSYSIVKIWGTPYDDVEYK